MNWNNVVSAVATLGGLAIVERRSDGTLGASRVIPQSTRSTPFISKRSAGGGGGTGFLLIPQQPSLPQQPSPCPPGTVMVNGQCVSSVSCPPGTVMVNGQCVPASACPPGMQLVNGQCVPTVTCPPGTHLVDGKCVS